VLFDFPARLFPVSLTGQRLLDPFLLSRLQVKGVSLDLLDNVLLLDLTLEAAKGVFERFTLLQFYFCQMNYTSKLDQKFPAYRREGTDIIQWLAGKVKCKIPAKPVPTGLYSAQTTYFK
jgi:hypothetical protein